MSSGKGIDGRRFLPIFLIGTVIFMALGFAATWWFGQMMGGPGPGSGVTPVRNVGTPAK